MRSSSTAETFLWQLEGSAVIRVSNKEVRMRKDDTLRVPVNTEFSYIPSSESMTMTVVMDPANKQRPLNN